MRDYTNICITCLSTDRRIVPLHKMASIKQEINFVEIKESTGGVCWECSSLLMKFHRFRKKAQAAQEALKHSKEKHNLKPLTSLTLKTNLLCNYLFTYNFDPLNNCETETKADPDSIKQEFNDNTDDTADNTSDIDEKGTENIENVYVQIEEIKHNNNLLSKTEKNNDHDVKENYLEIVLTEKETVPNTDIDKKCENVYVDTVETKPLKNLLRKGIKKSKKNKTNLSNNKILFRKTEKTTKADEKEVKEKFAEVVLTEEEMVKIREEKRNHHNFKKIPYKCDSCVLGFTRKETYNIHMEKKHEESIGTHICDVCCIRFSSKSSADKHRKKHFTCYRCKLCKYEAHELWTALNHSRSKHSSDRPDNIHCSKCDTVAKSPEDLEEHIQTKHSLYCNECGVKFKGMNTLRRHMARIHSTKRDFICDICAKTFKTKTRLESHMAGHNASLAKNLAYCHLCNVQYKNIYVYRNHLKYSANHSERAYSCPECNKKFASKVYWTKHYNFYHLQKSQFNCEICNKLFISDWRLKNHKQKHHGLTRSRDHTCNDCGKKFFTIATLRGHQLTHSEQRTYMCEDCGDTFKQRPALYTHMRLVHRSGGRRR